MQKNYNNFYPLLPPKIANKWEIVKTLNSSANSQIYIIKSKNSFDSSENTKILKIINKAFFNKNIYKKIISINSKYILKPSEVILFKQNYYIITNYHDNLARIICNNKISGNELLNMACDICISLKQLHSQKILHLDCTPANIYLNEDGSYCLGDFSSAILLNSKSTAITSTTLGYIPPEVSEGTMPNPLFDIYIFSSLLYALFNNGYSIDNSNSYNDIKDNIPQELYSIIIKGCSKNPSDRYSSIDEVEKELNSKIISEKLSDYNYCLNITDTSHPLYYLKTPLIKNNTAINNKKGAITHNVLYGALILTTCIIFLLSLYNYYTKKNLHTSTLISESEPIISVNPSIASIEPTPVYKPNTSPSPTPKHRPTLTPKPTYKPTASIRPNSKITELDISNKNLKSILNSQNTDLSYNKLTCLYANNNKIVNLKGIKSYTALNELYLSDNLINNLLPLEEIRQLKILVLSYNKITDLLPICSLTSLVHLDISGNNKMYNFSELINLYNLKTLNVTNTNITQEEIDFLTYYLPDCKILY